MSTKKKTANTVVNFTIVGQFEVSNTEFDQPPMEVLRDIVSAVEDYATISKGSTAKIMYPDQGTVDLTTI